jgi:hypothetical protein
MQEQGSVEAVREAVELKKQTFSNSVSNEQPG